MTLETALERPLPNNLDAERSVLGAILLDNHTLNAAIEKLRPEDFFVDQHRRIFGYMIELDELQQAIDLVTLSDHLQRKGELEAAGGAAYISQLMDGVPRVSNLEHYARIIKEKSVLRSLIHATHAIQQTALDGTNPAIEILECAEELIADIAGDLKSQTSSGAHNPIDASWPAPMGNEAFHGLAGDFVQAVLPETEADPVALLANFLVASGVLFGRKAYSVADGKMHYPVEYLAMVGETSVGRKGTATGRVLPVIEQAEDEFHNRILGGLSSGEGLVKAITESSEAERQFLVMLPELASLLGVMKREGNTMSAILREAWDGGRLRVLTRKEPLDVDNVNLSVIAHVTSAELLNGLTAQDRANGFGNRFLFACVRRSKLLPEGGTDVNLAHIVGRLREAVSNSENRGLIRRNGEAKEFWASIYPVLTAPRTGLRGALCGRAEAHVLRLSLIYALLDGVAEIEVDHLKAAFAFWAYCERSIDHLFAGQSGDPDADRLLVALGTGPKTISDLLRVFANNRSTDWLVAKLAALVRDGRVKTTTVHGQRKSSVPGWALKVS